MMIESLPQGQDCADMMMDLVMMLFRLEARATLAADVDVVTAAESLNREQRHSIACEMAEAISACRRLADAIDT